MSKQLSNISHHNNFMVSFLAKKINKFKQNPKTKKVII